MVSHLTADYDRPMPETSISKRARLGRAHDGRAAEREEGELPEIVLGWVCRTDGRWEQRVMLSAEARRKRWDFRRYLGGAHHVHHAMVNNPDCIGLYTTTPISLL